MSNAIKCDVCGHFVSYRDLETGAAIRNEITPDSMFTFEEVETICGACVKKARVESRLKSWAKNRFHAGS